MKKILISFLCLFFSIFSYAESTYPKRGSINIGKGESITTNDLPIAKLNKMFTQIANQTSQSVVSVTTFIKGASQNERNEKLWEYFFRQPYPYQNQQKKENLERPLGVGSGFIISNQGHILTNAHVIQKATRVKITLFNKNTYEADVVGVDTKTDVAVVKINAPQEELRTLIFGNSNKILIGEWVLAIGNPFGYDHTVTAGIISATGRRSQFYQGDGYYNYIQTDAAINPGNSGGPLVNLKGEVIGMNTLIVSRSGGYQGLSFAIPIRMAKKVAEDLIYEGKVVRGFLGVQITNVPSELSLALGLKSGYGAQIQQLVEESPAMLAGLKVSDIILEVDNIKIEDVSFLRNMISELTPGKTYPFSILRGEKHKILPILIGSLDKDFNHPKNENGSKLYGEYSIPHLGFRYRILPPEKRKKLNIKEQQGVLVSDITSLSIARNLKIEDIILSYKRSLDKEFIPIKDPATFYKILQKLGSEQSIAFYIYTQGKKRLIAIRSRKRKAEKSNK